ncbi:MAG TPA: hypothetical protein VK281_01795 [Xanthobacteraceae bacterium]|nr:hypothetical protein [Xanthobacteraceae bacterium]
MPLLVFRVPRHDDARSAVRELIGEQLRNVFAADLAQPLTGALAESLRRIEGSESSTAASAGKPGDPDGKPE